MSSDSHATITYTSMSSYEVIVNGYYGMPMDPLDPYVQLVMEAPSSPDYIPGPEAPPSPDYIPGHEAPPSPDYIPGPMYVLTHKALDAFCGKFHIPGEVHPVLPNRNDTMYERPFGKIGLYTSFFDYANFRFPLSTFLVDMLRHFCINISQLFVIEAATVSHFEILCRVYGIMPNVGLFRCFYVNSKKTRWMSLTDFNVQDYATLVAHPSPFRMFSEAFLCLVGLSRHYTLDEETYPWFLHKNREKMDIFAFIHTFDPTKQLEASVERLFDEGGSGNQMEQGDSARGGPYANIQLVVEVANTIVEDVALVQSRHQGKRKAMIVDAGGVSHPPKMLRVDHRTPIGASIGASVSTTPEREDGDHIDSVAEPNLCTVGAPYFVPIMTTITTTTSTVDPTLVTKKKFVEPSPFGVGSSSAGGTDPIMGSVTNGSRIDDDRVCHEMVDEFAPPKFFASVRGMEHDQLFTEFNVEDTRQMSLSAEVRIRAEYNVNKKRRLKSVVENQGELLKDREEKIESLKARLLLKEADAAKAIHLCAEASNFETVEKSLQDETNALRERDVILEKEQNALDVKVTELETLVVSKERDLIDLNALVTFSSLKMTTLQNRYMSWRSHLTNFKRRWLLTQGMELAIIKCLNSPEYLSALGAAIGKAIKKEFKSNKDASIEAVMTILCLEGPLAEKLGLDELQPNVDQLMVHIHHSPDKVVIGATTLSLALDVSNIRVRKPLSTAVLTGTKGTSDVISATGGATTTLSTTFSSASIIAPISVDDYEVIDAEDQVAANGNAASFPNVDDAKLNIVQ
uniref:Transposase (Putative), gypsy type n=1 Tax=Tanacetum cinerariifolium TaxID=118510 RepID=A0A6L2KZQ6_TANCI|nr:hypothetical protein [Tanacetum cinerariifolium]